MIGSVGSPVATSAIGQIPPGIVVSAYFGYNGSYGEIDTIMPSGACWVKVSTGGKLVLSGLPPAVRGIAHRPESSLSK